jgi:TonB family protein
VVRVRFNVGENGRVTSAAATGPSPWPLLNEAALRVIRERWRFPGGAARAYEVAIRFALTR